MGRDREAKEGLGRDGRWKMEELRAMMTIARRRRVARIRNRTVLWI